MTDDTYIAGPHAGAEAKAVGERLMAGGRSF
jgi:hypothetical protein